MGLLLEVGRSLARFRFGCGLRGDMTIRVVVVRRTVGQSQSQLMHANNSRAIVNKRGVARAALVAICEAPL